MNQQDGVEFRKGLSVFSVSMIVIGAIIGSGIFLTPQIIMRALGDARLVMLLWIVGGVVAVTGALTFAEISHVVPRTGGIYAFLSDAWTPRAGFLYGWCMLLVMNSGSIAALCIACMTYVAYLVPLPDWSLRPAAMLIALVLTGVNVAGVRPGSRVSNAFSLAKILGIALLVAAALLLPHERPLPALFASTYAADPLGALTIAMVGVLWSYGGWQYATFPAGEVRNPGRAIPLGILAGVGVVVLLYISANLAYLSVLPADLMARDERVAALTAERLIGPVGGTLVSLLIAISTVGTASVYTLSAPRIYYAMARDGMFLRSFGRLHPRFRTPHVALVAQCAMVMLFIAAGSFQTLISYVSFVDWIFYAAAASTLFVFRRRITAARAYSVPLYPVTPALFMLISLTFVAYLFLERPLESGLGFAFLLLGLAVSFLWKRRPAAGDA
jgi:APA family basic amino acid/polyamine antiporter